MLNFKYKYILFFFFEIFSIFARNAYPTYVSANLWLSRMRCSLEILFNSKSVSCNINALIDYRQIHFETHYIYIDIIPYLLLILIIKLLTFNKENDSFIYFLYFNKLIEQNIYFTVYLFAKSCYKLPYSGNCCSIHPRIGKWCF